MGTPLTPRKYIQPLTDHQTLINFGMMHEYLQDLRPDSLKTDMGDTQKVIAWLVTNFQTYLRNPRNRIKEEGLFKNWEYFDPVNFASNIRCRVLFGHNQKKHV